MPINESLGRPPVRLRSGQHDSPQAAVDIPRSSSPYTPFTRQANLSQSPITQSPPNNTNRGFLDNSAAFGGNLGGSTLGQAYGGGDRLAMGKFPEIFMHSQT